MAKVLTWNELWEKKPFMVWREDRYDKKLNPLAFIQETYTDRNITEKCVSFTIRNYENYNKSYRLWTEMPTEDDQIDTPWGTAI